MKTIILATDFSPAAKYAAIKKIGLACDCNKVALTIPVEEVVTLANTFNAKLHVLNVGNEESIDQDIIFESSLLKQMLLPLQPIYHFANTKNINQEILDFCEKQNIDLLIAMPKQHGLLNRLITSSQKRLVLHCHIPVAALHSLSY